MVVVARILGLLCCSTVINYGYALTPLFQQSSNEFANAYMRQFLPPLGQDTASDDHKYAFTPWSAFGQCSKVCGGGRRARTRSCSDLADGSHVILEKCYDQLAIGTYDLFTVIKYGKRNVEEEEEICNEHECQTSEWDIVTRCTRECGGGTLTQSRTCLNSPDQSKCNFESKKLVPCNTHECFYVQQWQEWSRCSKYCDVGETTRYRQCSPNAAPNTALYSKLNSMLATFAGITIFDALKSEEQVYYFSQYLNSCSRLHQKRFCNVGPCPRCPKNQVYHSCLPCTKHCKAMSVNDLRNWKFNPLDVLLAAQGCNGKCVHGCGCPHFAQYLGIDNACYQFPLLCPVNELSTSTHHSLILRLLAGNHQSEDSTPAVPETKTTTIATTTTTTVPPPPPTTTTTTTTSTTPPTTTSTVPFAIIPIGARRELETEATEKLYCPKDIPILEHDYCICNGVSKVVPCVAKPGQNCPMICKDVPTCPNMRSPRMKNAQECTLPECDSDSDCPNDGSLCCELLCGKRCIGGIQ